MSVSAEPVSLCMKSFALRSRCSAKEYSSIRGGRLFWAGCTPRSAQPNLSSLLKRGTPKIRPCRSGVTSRNRAFLWFKLRCSSSLNLCRYVSGYFIPRPTILTVLGSRLYSPSRSASRVLATAIGSSLEVYWETAGIWIGGRKTKRYGFLSVSCVGISGGFRSLCTVCLLDDASKFPVALTNEPIKATCANVKISSENKTVLDSISSRHGSVLLCLVITMISRSRWQRTTPVG